MANEQNPVGRKGSWELITSVLKLEAGYRKFRFSLDKKKEWNTNFRGYAFEFQRKSERSEKIVSDKKISLPSLAVLFKKKKKKFTIKNQRFNLF